MNFFNKIVMLSLVVSSIFSENVDVVVFSFDRPQQVTAFLRSLETLATGGVGQVSVVYRASDDEFRKGYEKVKTLFPYVEFFKQGKNPKKDFKPLTMRAAFASPSKYVVFAVDDIILTHHIDFSECTDLLKKTKAYGFYLRLGKNINYCYIQNLHTPVPQHKQVAQGVYEWNFKNGKGDWNYPNSVDLVVFEKKRIKQFFDQTDIPNPVLLEAYWSRWPQGKKGLFYEHSRMINIPVNIVAQDFSGRRNARSYTTKELLNSFLEGNEIDIKPFYHLDNFGVHQEYAYKFKKIKN